MRVNQTYIFINLNLQMTPMDLAALVEVLAEVAVAVVEAAAILVVVTTHRAVAAEVSPFSITGYIKTYGNILKLKLLDRVTYDHFAILGTHTQSIFSFTSYLRVMLAHYSVMIIASYAMMAGHHKRNGEEGTVVVCGLPIICYSLIQLS